jgi:hypothetical protein
MNGTGAYWAHLAKLRIVAEIMDTGGGTSEFWNASTPVQQQVLDVFAHTGAKVVVTVCPAERLPLASWEEIAGTPYCVRHLK